MNPTDFDTSKFKLGTLCKRGHDYEGTGQSLRTWSGGCCECKKNENTRKRRREYSANYYQDNKESKKAYCRNWANENPAATFWYCEERRNRISRQSDGTVTKDFAYDLFANSDKCCYCLAMFDSTTKATKKTVDHIIPIKLGGLHSARNLAICCFGCNNRKREKSYPEWLDCLEPKQRKSAEKLYYKRYGCSPIQGVLPLTFELEDKSDD